MRVMLKINLQEIQRDNELFKGEEHLVLQYMKKYFWKDTNPLWVYLNPQLQPGMGVAEGGVKG